MGQYKIALELPRSVEEIFDYLSRPAHLAALAPPDLHLELLEGPEVLTLGSITKWQVRRMGVRQTLANEVTQFEPNRLIVEEQRQGPFARWVLCHSFEAISPATCRLIEDVEFEPPSGMLGFVLTEKFILSDLAKLFAFREKKLGEIFLSKL